MQSAILCPHCRTQLSHHIDGLRCSSCSRTFTKNSDGYYVLLGEDSHDPKQRQDEAYVNHQETYPIRVYHEFLHPLLKQLRATTLLDVGCGLGTEVREALKNGYDAYGVDLPNMTPYWQRVSNDPGRFVACSAVCLPFPDSFFDFVWSLGVVEHIGTGEDTVTLVPEYESHRTGYARELVRVTKPGGKILVSCPNKSFPIDIQHGPTCGSAIGKLRWFVFRRTGLNFHRTWGKYHLLSYSDAKGLFMHDATVDSFKPLPLRDYFAFNRFQAGYLQLVRGAVTWYADNLPAPLLATFMNPYVLALVEKKA